MNKYCKLLNFLLLVPAAGYAQSSSNSELGRTLSGDFNNGYALAPPEAAGIQGSVFLMPGWLPGTLQLNGGSRPYSVPLKYDVYSMELRVKRPAGDSVVVPLLRVKEFSLAARRFACYPAAVLPADVGGGCGEVLYDNPAIQLLKFQRKEIVKRRAEDGGYASSTFLSTLEEQTRYYLRWAGDGHYSAIRPKRASLEQALASQPAALAALRAQKGSISSEGELVSALAAVAPQLAR